MIRVNILCEGPTEEQFVKKMLYPHFIEQGIMLTARSLGGGFSYQRLKHQIIQWLNNDQGAYVSTLVDLYGINSKYPGYAASKDLDAYAKVRFIENAVQADILGSPNIYNPKFVAHFQLHEFEALLFSAPEIMEEWLALDQAISSGSFAAVRNAFETPEHINDNPRTAPSKRILAIAPKYDKVAEGLIIAQEIGLPTIRAACPHFNRYCLKIEQLALENDV